MREIDPRTRGKLLVQDARNIRNRFPLENFSLSIPKKETEPPNNIPAVARLKENPETLRHYSPETTSLIQQFILDKSFSVMSLRTINYTLLNFMFHKFVLRQSPNNLIGFDRALSQLLSTILIPTETKEDNKPQPLGIYKGTAKENMEIDQSINKSIQKDDPRRQFSGKGITKMFELGYVMPETKQELANVPIIVIGGGPAGIMTARAMLEMGFRKKDITVIDRSDEWGGIWRQRNVAQGSKNNPLTFDFLGRKLESAPGSGETVSKFLHDIAEGYMVGFNEGALPLPTRAIVTSIKPGDLNHTVNLRTPDTTEKTIVAPIVINAMGVGKPLNPNNEYYMTTDTPKEAGIRWQQIITAELAEKYRNKTLILVGLGNSTAEMLIQIHKLNAQGYNIDYRIITHYPKESVDNPRQEISKDGRNYHIFRNLKESELTKWEGDLEDAERAYMQALSEKKIVSDVKHWNSKNGRFTAIHTDGTMETFEYKQQFTLIGYGQDAEILRSMGMVVTNEKKGDIAYDYDGEIQRTPDTVGRERLYPGYFGIGAILKTDWNPNAVVMPGIMHRMYDMLFTILIRAAEYKRLQRNK